MGCHDVDTIPQLISPTVQAPPFSAPVLKNLISTFAQGAEGIDLAPVDSAGGGVCGFSVLLREKGEQPITLLLVNLGLRAQAVLCVNYVPSIGCPDLAATE